MSPWLEGLQIAFQWDNLLYVLIGTVLGVLFGVLPGVGAIQGMALLLPLTFGLEPASALIILGGMFGGSIYGGAITSILINTPGDPTSAATTFDGYPMARKGQAGVAIGAATAVSTFGNLAGIAVLMVAAPPLARVALKFGPPEYFSLAVLGLTVIAVAARESVLKGLVSAGLGLFLSFVGMSLALGYPRFTYGISYLDDGLPFVSLTVGIFAVSEALMLIERGGRIAEVGKVVGGVWEGAVKAFHYPVTLIRSVLIGIWLGILPGVGATTANFV
ncbi:MAG: tripartite tricarboxylate transporter permease, partial [Firmicutes bacterium]|nr:tripartite tricarboxylate transporter permease [Bacillota bacterium]